jgi:kinesin family protein 3/17
MAKKAQEREAVKVAVRLRPMSSNEVASNFQTIVEIDQPNAGVYVRNKDGQVLNFKFDFAYPPGISQEEVYETTAAPIVSSVLEGMNGTIFAYGQTGTGKTYTMDGKTGDQRGITSRAFEHIFDYIAANSEDHQFMVAVNYVEIYNDELRDLLLKEDPKLARDQKKKKDPLKIYEDPNHGVVIRGVTVREVTKLEDLWDLMELGKQNRKVRKTNMNAESSRSHAILTLTIETLSQIEGRQHVRSARLNLVDLAGSERVAKTGAEGEGFAEGVNINYELMILGNCIAALTDKSVKHVPYRDSKLTMLLRDSLGGNAKTIMIAALGPADYNFQETMSTLRYAERAKKIENKPKVNMDPKDALLLKYQEELAALQAQLNGGGGPGIGGAPGAPEKNQGERIAEMEAVIEAQMKKLASGASMAKAEREQLEKELEAKRHEIEGEREKHSKLQARLAELGKYLVNGRDLQKVTQKNEQQINQIREKLRQREERALALEREVEERRRQKQHVVDQCSSIQQQVEVVAKEFDELVAQYRNLKLKLPEVQNTIQADRENLAQNIQALNRRIELYQLIIDNFVPQAEAENLKKIAVWDEEKRVYRKQEVDKRTLAQKVVSVERPKSATGAAHPSAGSTATGSRLRKHENMPTVQIGPVPVKSRLKPGPMKLKARSVEESILAAFQDTEAEIVIDIPTFIQRDAAGDGSAQ